jgi:hypothetical protein
MAIEQQAQVSEAVLVEKEKTKRTTTKTLIIVGAVLGSILLCCGSCVVFSAIGQNSSNTKSSGTTTTTTTSDSTKTPKKYKQNEVVEADGFRFSITEVKEYSESNQFMQPKEGMKYLAIMPTVENISNSSKYFGATYFTLKSKDGEQYDAGWTTIAPDLKSEDIQPTMKAKGYLVFEVPNSTTTNNLYLMYNGSMFSNTQVIWELN